MDPEDRKGLWRRIRRFLEPETATEVAGLIGASIVPGVGTAIDAADFAAGVQDRDPLRMGIAAAAFAVPFVGVAGIKAAGRGIKSLFGVGADIPTVAPRGAARGYSSGGGGSSGPPLPDDIMSAFELAKKQRRLEALEEMYQALPIDDVVWKTPPDLRRRLIQEDLGYHRLDKAPSAENIFRRRRGLPIYSRGQKRFKKVRAESPKYGYWDTPDPDVEQIVKRSQGYYTYEAVRSREALLAKKAIGGEDALWGGGKLTRAQRREVFKEISDIRELEPIIRGQSFNNLGNRGPGVWSLRHVADDMKASPLIRDENSVGAVPIRIHGTESKSLETILGRMDLGDVDEVGAVKLVTETPFGSRQYLLSRNPKPNIHEFKKKAPWRISTFRVQDDAYIPTGHSEYDSYEEVVKYFNKRRFKTGEKVTELTEVSRRRSTEGLPTIGADPYPRAQAKWGKPAMVNDIIKTAENMEQVMPIVMGDIDAMAKAFHLQSVNGAFVAEVGERLAARARASLARNGNPRIMKAWRTGGSMDGDMVVLTGNPDVGSRFAESVAGKLPMQERRMQVLADAAKTARRAGVDENTVNDALRDPESYMRFWKEYGHSVKPFDDALYIPREVVLVDGMTLPANGFKANRDLLLPRKAVFTNAKEAHNAIGEPFVELLGDIEINNAPMLAGTDQPFELVASWNLFDVQGAPIVGSGKALDTPGVVFTTLRDEMIQGKMHHGVLGVSLENLGGLGQVGHMLRPMGRQLIEAYETAGHRVSRLEGIRTTGARFGPAASGLHSLLSPAAQYEQLYLRIARDWFYAQ